MIVEVGLNKAREVCFSEAVLLGKSWAGDKELEVEGSNGWMNWKWEKTEKSWTMWVMVTVTPKSKIRRKEMRIRDMKMKRRVKREKKSAY